MIGEGWDYHSGMRCFSWLDILTACIRVPKRLAKALLVMSLMIALSIVVVRLEEGRREAREQEAATAQLQDCQAWASMNVKQKKKVYRADPKRWDACFCEGEDCKLDRIYIGQVVEQRKQH